MIHFCNVTSFQILEEKSLITDGQFLTLKYALFLYMAVNEKSISLINSCAHGYHVLSVCLLSVKYSGSMISAQISKSW